MADLSWEHNSNVATMTFQIVDVNQENVPSGNTAEALQLISRLASIGTPPATKGDQVPEGLHKFPDLTQTTGTLPGTYTIKLEPNAKGGVHAARHLPVALKERAINKLHEMEANGYIVKVTEPTEWVSSMVVSIQGDKVRICIDPSNFKKVIKREHYPMRTIEEVISTIPHAKVFSKLDAKSGFLQIKLDEASSLLTTLNTPLGRYRWLRLPFGIKCAPEIFSESWIRCWKE